MSHTRSIVATLGVAAVVSGMTAGITLHAAPAAQAAAGPAVSVWETTANQSQLLAPQAGAAFASGASSAAQVITVDPSTTYQTMTGFGASFTDSSAWLVYNSPLRSSIMTKLFDPNQGIGLDFLRQPIGASDFSTSLYSYDDMPSGQSDPTLAHFSTSHDNAYIIPILQQALALNPQTTIMATPWSPPGWMKSSGSMIGGSLQSADYQYFANYLVKFLQAYQAAGVPVSLITAQNEPEYSPSNYPGSTLTAAQEQSFIADNLGPAIKAAGLSTGILAYDHNWNDPGFPETILGNSASAQYVVGTAWHCYAGDVSAQTTVNNLYPTKGTYFTECSGTEGSSPAATFSGNLDWDVENLIIDSVRDYAKTAVTWNMALNPSYGPSMNCTNCTALVTVDNSADTATYNAEYYSLGQASKFVKPGAVRINSNTFGSGKIEDVAFRNPDGSTAMVVLNSNTSSSNTFGVSENGQYFNYTLPAGAVATFTWPASGTAPPSPVDSSAWYEVKNTNSNLCVEAASAGIANGTAVDQNTCTGAANQLWQFQADGNGYFHVANKNAPTEVWDITGGANTTANGAAIQLWSSTGGANQQWQPVSLGNGYYHLVAQNSGTECLDVTNTSTTAGALMQQWACSTPDPAQSFQLVQIGGATSSPTPTPTVTTAPPTTPGGPVNTSGWYEVKNTNSNLCVEAASAGTANGTAVDQNTCTGAANQLWQFQAAGAGGAYQVANENAPGEVWDVTGGTGATANGTAIQLWSATGATNQQWQPVSLGNGYYHLVAQNSGTECLDVTNTSTATGALMQQWACSTPDPAQSFQLAQVS